MANNYRTQRTTRSRWLWIILLLLLLLLWLILAYFGGLWPFRPAAEYRLESFLIEDQVIVSGPQVAVDAAIGALPPGTVIARERLDLSPMLVGTSCPGLRSTAPDSGHLVVDLYQITDTGLTLAELIAQIEAFGGAEVTAEPNWLSGSPWEIEGSPWEIEGSPWEIEGSGTGQILSASAADFQEQWAWTAEAIDLYGARERPSGAGVQVAIFDTSPFDQPVPGDPPLFHSISWVGNASDPLRIQVVHPQPAATPAPEEMSRPGGLNNHGLFVAGLVHAVAPASDIQLIRVLGDDKRGDLFTLNRALVEFVGSVVPLRPTGIVMNLSLGLRIPPEEAGFDLPDQVQSLRDIMAIARCLNIVVVAAAGNNSAGAISPEPPNLPAAWSSVMGVTASNQANGRACFSNRGDVAAPGGDGRDPVDRAGHCAPKLTSCQGPNCAYALIGPVLMPPAETGYTYWTGSSFAAPLVSGLAALVLEQGGGNLSAADVQAVIECGARPGGQDLGRGVINVRHTLERCLGRASFGVR
jgi:subtilisin family serine protease